MPASQLQADIDQIRCLARVLWRETAQWADYDRLPADVRHAYLRWASTALDLPPSDAEHAGGVAS